ncbi:MAG: hypothetical protein E7587_00375 [Ruminococcaceae bacterium]|nr:hypothetical protein [Oscillospiraceae bacterium]
MKYCKLKNDGSIEELKDNLLSLDGMIYSNPSPARLKEQGYKPLFSESEPEYNKETEILERIYTQTEEHIIESFVIRKRSAENEVHSL